MSESGWHADPYGRHEHRWYDGNGWTSSVADAGVTGEDPPVPGPLEPPAPPSTTSSAPAGPAQFAAPGAESPEQQPTTPTPPAPGWAPGAGAPPSPAWSGAGGTPPPAGGYPPGPAMPGPGAGTRSSNRTLWIVLGVILGLFVLVGGGCVAFIAFVGNETENLIENAEGFVEESNRALADQCRDGDFAACDQLYFQTPGGSELQAVALSCGGRSDGEEYTGTCAATFGAGADTTDTTDSTASPDDDPALESLAEDCRGGDNAACDSLYRQTPLGSELEELAMDCGGRSDGREYRGTCQEELG